MCGFYFLVSLVICPDWGNDTQAYLAGFGSIGLNNSKMFTVYSIKSKLGLMSMFCIT